MDERYLKNILEEAKCSLTLTAFGRTEDIVLKKKDCYSLFSSYGIQALKVPIKYARNQETI